ncbi:low-density lipoprotein receptor-related protein 4-like isoform X2 [Pecten maximus]|uniref:low-density lipoprotein receptor-related protein 4-like isoform X2 n=1 Tax=Pecten maximus TaxID=6579 RepID=UPI001457F0D8|nr:low-density lipoprotein receptor-related protein 4-like isoform X2 [Pecten maximus]
MVFDWIDRNLYWSETTGKVKYVTIATSFAKELVQVSSPPSHITIDPHNRTLFWVEGTSGFEMKIVAMSLVSNVKSVILTHPSPAYIKDIFFDVSSDRVYFVQFDKLSSIERNGSGIHHYFSGLRDLDRLVIYKRYAIWSTTTGPNVYSVALQQISLQMANLTNKFGVISGLAVYDKSLQRLTKGPCSHLNGGCEQLCMTGISGRAVCSCSYGLTLQNDGRSCSSVPQSSQFLLVTDINHGRLVQISTINARITTLDINAAGRPIDALVDLATSFVYWTDLKDDSIMKSTLNGRHIETVYVASGAESYLNSLAMDQSNGNLYFSVTGETGTTSPGSVGVLRPSTGLAKTLVTDLSHVEGLVLYPSKGLMFYTHDDDDDDADSFTRIIRASMDGTSPSVIISLDPEDFFTDLAIDYTSDRLYWSSMKGGVESSSLSGSVRTKYTTPTNRIRSIAIAGDYLYFTSDGKHKIIKMQNENEVTFMTDNAELGFLLNMHVYPGQSQPASSVCASNNGGCSTFCLPKSSPSSSYCACQDGVDLKSDDPFTCEGVTRCPSAIPNGMLKDPCTRNAAEVCTFQCDSGYSSTIESDTLTCGQDGQWSDNPQVFCQGD